VGGTDIMEMSKEGLELPDAVCEARMMAMDEIRNLALERRLRDQKTLYNKANPRFSSLQEGDLVLIRRLAQDNQHGHKLEARWDGPQRLMRMAAHGRSV